MTKVNGSVDLTSFLPCTGIVTDTDVELNCGHTGLLCHGNSLALTFGFSCWLFCELFMQFMAKLHILGDMFRDLA